MSFCHSARLKFREWFFNNNEQTCSLQITESVYLKECPDKLTKCPNRRSASQSVTEDRFPKNWRRSVNSSSQLINGFRFSWTFQLKQNLNFQDQVYLGPKLCILSHLCYSYWFMQSLTLCLLYLFTEYDFVFSLTFSGSGASIEAIQVQLPSPQKKMKRKEGNWTFSAKPVSYCLPFQYKNRDRSLMS